MNAFTRLAAIFVGLANLAVLIMLEGVDPAVQRGDVVWSQALLPVVLAVVVAGLLTSEIVLRWFKQSALAEECSERCGVVIGAVCLGGASMGGLLVPALTPGAVLAGGESEITPAAVSAVLIYALFSVFYGAAMGFLEGMFIAVPLGRILGLFGNRS
jgi:hypothetical protein